MIRSGWIMLGFFILVMLSAASADDGNDLDTLKATIEFQENKFDFGDITEGIIVSHVFKFTNIGSDTLIINRVRGS